MKRRISLALAVLMLVCSFSLMGCSARSATDADGFRKAAEAAGYTVTDAEAQSPATGALSAKRDDIEIDFYTTPSGKDAQSIFSQKKDSLTASGGQGQSLDSDTYCKYSVSSGDLYYQLVRNGVTLVIAKAGVNSKSTVESFLKSIHY